MIGYLPSTDLSLATPIETEKAWHLLSVLLRLGRPARPAELAARCELFHASADLVEFLCSVSDSPLSLTRDLFVTASLKVFSALGEFESRVLAPFVPRVRIRFLGQKMRAWDDSVQTYSRRRKGLKMGLALLSTPKRRLLLSSENGEDCPSLHSPAKKMRTTLSKEDGDVGHHTFREKCLLSVDVPVMGNSLNFKQARNSPLLLEYNSMLPNCDPKFTEHLEGAKVTEMECDNMTNITVNRESIESMHLRSPQHNILNFVIDLNAGIIDLDVESDPMTGILQKPELCNGTQKDENCSKVNDQIYVENVMPSTIEMCLGATPSGNVVNDCHNGHAPISGTLELAGTFMKGEDFLGTSTSRGPENSVAQYCTVQMGEHPNNVPKLLNKMVGNSAVSTTKKQVPEKVRSSVRVDIAKVEPFASSKLLRKTLDKQKTLQMDPLNLDSRVLLETDNKIISSPKQQEKLKRSEKLLKHKWKRSCTQTAPQKEKQIVTEPKDPKKNMEQKPLPDFESFIIEEEEGSGGYGTVYRARRKSDGKIFAVKCPHPNAHTRHVANELRMLQRFGGRNFVIKYEGSFKSGISECFVLEHVEHDRPEVLKREIDVSGLQWYGYCLFRALASLHKHGIVHRDVKPGNFLFSRKLSKGYLIDFNLAVDLNQKYSTSSNPKTNYMGSLDHIPYPIPKDTPCSNEATKTIPGTCLEVVNRMATKDFKLHPETKNLKKSHLKAFPDGSRWNIHRNQAADGSGVTSARDATSTRTPSAERLREPVPCQGRKELISLVQEALQSPNQKTAITPVSQRKRVAAPPGKADRKFIYLSPMPLNSNGIPVAGASLLKSTGDKKQKREGPCVGTKGFRAPEVLFKSPHQSPKVDIWSAGVTLLYLIMGKSPFVGDPEQNIKDIAKLRGSEDLWEVAKLHNCEISFPPDLFDIQSLPSVELQEWYEQNTKRFDFHEQNTRGHDFRELLDLINKCLTVNPRLRISADEALRHRFFTPCHEALRKQRLLRQALSSEPGSQSM